VRAVKLAVGEVAANSIRHAGGSGEALLWPTGESVVCELRDTGVVTNPLVGLV
jgi:hypothetical protein